MPSISTSPSRSLSSDAIEATRALASRERQEAASAKKAAKGKVSLGGSALKTEETIVQAKRAEYARSEEARLAARPAAVELSPKLRLKGVDEDGKPFDDATPERINQARVGQDVTTTAGVRQFSDPFSVLRNKGLLDKDKAVNEALFSAGMELRRRYDQADLGGVKAMNLMKDIVDGGAGDAGCPIADRAWDARRKIREGHAAVGARLWPYVMGVVVEDRTVESLSGMVQDSKAERLRYVIAMERLREALHRLCEAWGIQANDKPRAIQSLREGDEDRSFERRGRKG